MEGIGQGSKLFFLFYHHHLVLVHSEYSINIERSKEGRGILQMTWQKTSKKLGILCFKPRYKGVGGKDIPLLKTIRSKTGCGAGGKITNTHESGDDKDNDDDNNDDENFY